jgi:hypothetical protein
MVRRRVRQRPVGDSAVVLGVREAWKCFFHVVRVTGQAVGSSAWVVEGRIQDSSEGYKGSEVKCKGCWRKNSLGRSWCTARTT